MDQREPSVAHRTAQTNARPLVLEPVQERLLALRPFFGYYGGKWRDAQKNYPAPKFRRLVEPFAGSAGYSLRYPDREVHLYEIDEVIVSVWQYLIRVKASEILRIPDLPLDRNLVSVPGRT